MGFGGERLLRPEPPEECVRPSPRLGDTDRGLDASWLLRDLGRSPSAPARCLGEVDFGRGGRGALARVMSGDCGRLPPSRLPDRLPPLPPRLFCLGFPAAFAPSPALRSCARGSGDGSGRREPSRLRVGLRVTPPSLPRPLLSARREAKGDLLLGERSGLGGRGGGRSLELCAPGLAGAGRMVCEPPLCAWPFEKEEEAGRFMSQLVALAMPFACREPWHAIVPARTHSVESELEPPPRPRRASGEEPLLDDLRSERVAFTAARAYTLASMPATLCSKVCSKAPM